MIVTGRQGDRPVRFERNVSLADAEQGNSFIPRLWARMHLDCLVAAGRHAGDQGRDHRPFGGVPHHHALHVALGAGERRRPRAVQGETRFHMRDGEKFFAQGMANADFELIGQQMQRAAGWRIGLRSSVLQQLSRLGRDAAVAAPRSVGRNILRSIAFDFDYDGERRKAEDVWGGVCRSGMEGTSDDFRSGNIFSDKGAATGRLVEPLHQSESARCHGRGICRSRSTVSTLGRSGPVTKTFLLPISPLETEKQSLMMMVTPRIIIPDEEEERLGVPAAPGYDGEPTAGKQTGRALRSAADASRIFPFCWGSTGAGGELPRASDSSAYPFDDRRFRMGYRGTGSGCRAVLLRVPCRPGRTGGNSRIRFDDSSAACLAICRPCPEAQGSRRPGPGGRKRSSLYRRPCCGPTSCLADGGLRIDLHTEQFDPRYHQLVSQADSLGLAGSRAWLVRCGADGQPTTVQWCDGKEREYSTRPSNSAGCKT